MARRILLADDSVTAQNMGRKILTDAGYEVVAVNNGSAALKKIAEHKPDIIVLDVYMPGYSGLEVCQRIKENRETARIPVLLTVGKLEPFKPEEARKAGADAFVVKPFEASELLTALTKLEDKIIPSAEPYKQGRFAKAVAAIEDDGPEPGEKFGDKDQGWRSRLRFPSRKQKAAEPEEVPGNATVGGKDFRDLRAGEGPRAAEPAAPVKPAPANPAHEFERPLPSGLPHDITPEEIAAITAAATKLSGTSSEVPAASESSVKPLEPSVPVAEAVASASATSAPSSTAADESAKTISQPAEEATHSAAVEAVVAPTAESVVAPEAVPSVESGLPHTVGTDEGSPVTFASAHGTEIEGNPDVATPMMRVPETAAATPALEEELKVEAPPEAASRAQQEDTESAKSVVPATEEIAAPTVDAVSAPHVSEMVEEVMAASAQLPAAPTVPTTNDDQVPAVSSAATSTGEEPKAAEAAPVPLPAVETAAIIPADDDVMAALQSLIPPPSPEAATVSGLPGQPSAGNAVDLSYVGTQASSPRWVAEEIALSPEEGGASLEREMEAAYAAFAASEAARLLASSVVDTFPGAQPVVPQAVAADVLASADVQGQAGSTGSEAAEPAAIAVPAAESAPAFVMAARAGERGGSAPTGTATSAPATSQISSAPASAPEEASPAAISMPAAAAHETKIVPAEPVPAPAIAEESSLAGGTDDMDRKHSESLGFKMIRQSPAASKAAAKAEPVSKENFEVPAASPEPAARAAAATAESAPSSASAVSVADPKAIASIVDSVLAELRPKIVEEIAKKLAGDGKKE